MTDTQHNDVEIRKMKKEDIRFSYLSDEKLKYVVTEIDREQNILTVWLVDAETGDAESHCFTHDDDVETFAEQFIERLKQQLATEAH